MNILINQPRSSYFVGGGEMISFDHAINFLKLNNEVSFITINPKSIGSEYSEQYKKFFDEYKEKINFIEIEQDEKIKDIYKIKPGENRCRWNVESIYFNKKLHEFIVNENKYYDVMLSYYNLDAVFIPQTHVKKNVLYLCGYPKQVDDYQGSFLSVYDKVIAISKETQEYWQKYRNDKISVISTGVDYARFSPSDKCHNDRTSVKVLYVGRLISRKNVDRIILAVNKLKRKYNINLTIVGEGPEKEYLESLSGDANFVGVVANTEYYYNLCDIFVSPSEFGEGVQGTMLEAMSCGLKVVATNNSVNSCLLGSGRGILINTTIDDIANGIELAISLDKDKIANLTRDYIVKNYDWLKKTRELQKEIEQ